LWPWKGEVCCHGGLVEVDGALEQVDQWLEPDRAGKARSSLMVKAETEEIEDLLPDLDRQNPFYTLGQDAAL
jgi:hypothetical protein